MDNWKEIEKEFYKECCQTFPGNSGIGGNDPQDPDVQISCYPEDILNFFKSRTNHLVHLSEKEVKECLRETLRDLMKHGEVGLVNMVRTVLADTLSQAIYQRFGTTEISVEEICDVMVKVCEEPNDNEDSMIVKHAKAIHTALQRR